ncbi:hypothetical protein XA68_18049 [Ophiocordyceps unilateralis]|uniref:Uncharacterized protein n=1 Tax=Ophiocordyceps unilateralis TaxID=268505 RepID=A0A2A9PK16_OPHUN|nr:hypothetical protein XA68_18049 [Ophiocordyceps unilateralis]
MLRRSLRSPVRILPLRPGPAPQRRSFADSLGGPGGQQPPPSKPNGIDALRRNWMPIGGAALALVAAYAYFRSPEPPVESRIKTQGSKPLGGR